ncbi:hypothetical protein [Aureliella helgolandensis]|uniref:Uncharacterized protein n=1 Tax=Aureliella helgolandensis TaxID=2527968 RepID=A0A518G754_9BACT|nr:hypothetical protein [Aureliella helgolandensis]QDV24420.1 hypothetical protein Q31a_27370 [Aureliella helgolandensis]
MQVPALCSRCGLLFESFLPILNGDHVYFQHNKQSCPRPGCDGVADLMDLGYSGLLDGIEQARNFVLSIMQKQRLGRLADMAIAEGFSFEEISAKSDEIAPGLGKTIKAELEKLKEGFDGLEEKSKPTEVLKWGIILYLVTSVLGHILGIQEVELLNKLGTAIVRGLRAEELPITPQKSKVIRPSVYEPQQFHDAKNALWIMGRLVRVDSGMVTIKRFDGKVFNEKIEKFSVEDQMWISQQK